MPTNNKTTNLNLNSWLTTDKPKREDFVSDNVILDTIISAHLNNSDAHLSSNDREKLTTPFVAGLLSGDGNATQIHTLSFEPKLVLVYLKNQPLLNYVSASSYTLCNAGIAFNSEMYCSIGISLSGSSLTLSQSTTASNNIFVNLNKYLGQYVYIAFK